jgi:DNA processing protein
MGASAMDDRTATIAVACLAEPGASGVADRMAEVGPQAVLAELTAAGARSPVRGRIDPTDVPAMLAEQVRRGVRVLVPGDAEFPSQLLDLSEPPVALWVRGPMDLRMTTLRSVAVVGSRACSPYGERATAVIAGGVAETGWAVVSGGAFGIDAAAHRAALGVGGATVAILAGGVDVVYPRAHDSLLCRIADTGALVSELPPGSPPLRHRFLARNRLIAAVSRGTVIVEAARRSGAIATANRAMDLGRVVMAVPGPITAMASAGTNRLLHEQAARAVSDCDEVIGLVLGHGAQSGADRRATDAPQGLRGAPGSGGTHHDPRDAHAAGGSPAVQESLPLLDRGIPEEVRGILVALPRRGGISLESLAVRVSEPEAVCLARLGLLEVAGLVTRSRRGWRRSD